jgi:hypothetical protein
LAGLRLEPEPEPVLKPCQRGPSPENVGGAKAGALPKWA